MDVFLFLIFAAIAVVCAVNVVVPAGARRQGSALEGLSVARAAIAVVDLPGAASQTAWRRPAGGGAPSRALSRSLATGLPVALV